MSQRVSQRKAAWGLLAALSALWVVSLSSGYDVIADVDPTRISQPPGGDAWLGTDPLGRDVFWRMITATRGFMGPGLGAMAIAAIGGIPAGAAAGYLGGWPSLALRQLFGVLSAVPRFVLVLLALSIYGARPEVLAIGAGLAFTPDVCEAVRARIAELRHSEFVLAARAHGLSEARILLVHLLWHNCRGVALHPLIGVLGTTLVLETTLSYLGGFGVAEPAPSWGNMIALSMGHDNPWAWAAPAAAIWLAVLATNRLARAAAAPDA